MESNTNIVIQGVTDETITLLVNGEMQKVLNRLDALQNLLEQQQTKTIQTADKIYNIASINEANFGFVMDQSNHDKNLPEDLAEDLITERNIWVESLYQALLKQKISVNKRPFDIFQHYGSLIETFLQKMNTKEDIKELRRLSFMAEVFQSSLRYLCYIQVSQILLLKKKPRNEALSDFFHLDVKQYKDFDFLNFLFITTEILREEENFMPEIGDFVHELLDTYSDLCGTALFLEKHRNRLIKNSIPEDEHLEKLLDEYFTGLIFWLRHIAFLAKYRMVSINNIDLKYRLGTSKTFVHLYGELHGIYDTIGGDENDEEESDFDLGSPMTAYEAEGFFTYNQSVLLFRGSHVGSSFENISRGDNYLSLSPLIIDKTVFDHQGKQTPEIYYYTGRVSKQYHYALYKNELPFGGLDHISTNREIEVKSQNTEMPKLNELFQELSPIFKWFKMPRR